MDYYSPTIAAWIFGGKKKERRLENSSRSSKLCERAWRNVVISRARYRSSLSLPLSSSPRNRPWRESSSSKRWKAQSTPEENCIPSSSLPDPGLPENPANAAAIVETLPPRLGARAFPPTVELTFEKRLHFPPYPWGMRRRSWKPFLAHSLIFN